MPECGGVAGLGDGDVGESGGLVRAVLPVVVADRESAAGGVCGPLPELVGPGLARGRGNHRQGAWFGVGEAGAGVGGDRQDDVVVAGAVLDAGIEVVAAGCEAGGCAAGRFIGVPVEVGA